MPFHNPRSTELHGFCDASESAYGACMYIKCISASNEVLVVLLTSKSRVSPLELCGAVLLATLMAKCIDALKLKSSINIFYWTDSTIFFTWPQHPSNCWKTFVGNRVSEIQSLSCVSDWRHVATDDTPADYISHGVCPAQLQSLHQWWHGPNWLRQPEARYKNFYCTSYCVEESLLEEKHQLVAMVIRSVNDEAFVHFFHFLDYPEFLRMFSGL